jgi:hypothetical protein
MLADGQRIWALSEGRFAETVRERYIDASALGAGDGFQARS